MLYFDELTSPQANGLRADSRVPVLLLPVGAVEPHGPHAPLGTDGLISAGMCARAAERLADDREVRVAILPPLPYGVTRYAAAFPGAVSVSEETLHALVVDICVSLSAQAMDKAVIVNNHFEPEHLQALYRAADTVAERTGHRPGLLDLTRRANAERLTAEFQAAECHAGRYETSLVLADRPELVDAGRMHTLPYLPVNMAEAIGAGQHDFVTMGMTEAYCGAPAEATAAEGQATFDVLTDLLVEEIRATVRRPRNGVGGS